MYTDPSTTTWAYYPAEIGDDVQRIWIGMPPKLQLVEWLNHASVLYVKWAEASPGSNPDFVCGDGGTFPNPDKDFNVIQNWVRADSTVRLSIPSVSNLALFKESALRPKSDSIDPNSPPW